ncbi:MAG: MerR family transcriptional regulator [Actinomycetaceae bacterium]|nr:MerR family transcriptional regulator [Actinomycetaceae bacterium]
MRGEVHKPTASQEPAAGEGPTASQELTVGQVADLVGVSVRTLHHWDAVGLVTPRARSWSGYRLYDAEDIDRIYRVCLYRETGMPLSKIGQVLDDPHIDVVEHLVRQRQALVERISHLTEMVSAVDLMMEMRQMGKNLTPSEQAEIFGSQWNPAWQEEAEANWGSTAEWAQAQERKANMTKEDWKRVKDETEAFEARLAEAMKAGVEPGSERANELADEHLRQIAQWFDMSYSKQVIIAEGYDEDGRFREHYDAVAPGLAAWLKAIIKANASAHGVDTASVTWQ